MLSSTGMTIRLQPLSVAQTFVPKCEIATARQQLPHQAAELVWNALADALLHLPLMRFHVCLPVRPAGACTR